MRALLASLLVVSALLAGCATGPTPTTSTPSATTPPPPPPPPELKTPIAPPNFTWPVALSVNVTPGEPNERPGATHVTWGANDSMGETLSDSPILSAKVLRIGDELYLNRSGIAWTRANVSDRAPYFSVLTVQFSDLKFLVSRLYEWRPAKLPNGTTLVRGNGTLAAGAQVATFNVTLYVSEGRLVWAQARSSFVPETPYSYRAGPAPNLTIARPTRWLYAPTALAANRAAADRHLLLVKFLKGYVANHSGRVPPSVDPTTLASEVTAAHASWPANVFTQKPMRADRAPGDFTWMVCADDAARYVGYGWDDATVTGRLGNGNCLS